MSDGEFTATHQAPDAGLETWNAPDPAQKPDNRIEAALPVHVLEETTGWAHVRCSNGWETWVDAAKLVALATPGFVPTHQVVAAGVDARARPDMEEPVAARLDGGLPVSIANTWGGWMKVHFENGWETWVDQRGLTAGIASAVAGVTSASPLAMWLPIIGAAVAILGGFLDWFPQTSAWDLGFVGLFTHEGQDLASNDFSGGLVLLLSAGAALPLLTRRPLPRWWALAVAGVATNVALMGFVLYFDVKVPGLSIGIGIFVTLLGGIAMAVGALIAPRRAG
ncbi:MAG: SH3 domain-containing protein [Acidimicrobiia bacterium]